MCSSEAGKCSARECGVNGPCGDPAKFCDLTRGLCLPLSGACSSRAECLLLPPELLPFEAECGGSHLCEIHQPLAPFPAPAAATLVLVAPTPGQNYSTETAWQAVWSPMDRPAFVEIFTRELTSTGEYGDAVVWAASWTPGKPPPRWEDGFRVEAGRWERPANHLPTGVPLYVVALAVDGPTLTGKTALTPFSIGSNAWPLTGSRCVTPKECFNPARPATCVDEVCQMLCLSDFGCPRGHLCNAPLKGVRTCAP